jgi:ComF family protein
VLAHDARRRSTNAGAKIQRSLATADFVRGRRDVHERKHLFDPRAAAIVRDLARECIDALYPPVCPLCRARDLGDGLGCAQHRLPLVPLGPRCGRCAAALPPAIADGERCAECRARSPGFQRVVALSDYRSQPAVQEWILALKHGRRPDLARALGAALGARIACASEDADGAREILVPVPLHVWRRVERGYDQALLLARAAGEVAGLRVVRALRRVRATGVQGAAGSSSRTANVAAAFAPARARLGARVFGGVRDAHVWLVDDVVTSGATVAECARVLRRMGARNVGVLALARASG